MGIKVGTLGMLGVAALGALLAACEPTGRLRCIQVSTKQLVIEKGIKVGTLGTLGTLVMLGVAGWGALLVSCKFKDRPRCI